MHIWLVWFSKLNYILAQLNMFCPDKQGFIIEITTIYTPQELCHNILGYIESVYFVNHLGVYCKK